MIEFIEIFVFCSLIHSCVPNLLMSPIFFIHFRYDHSAGHAIFVVISVLLFHFLVTGAILATCCW